MTRRHDDRSTPSEHLPSRTAKCLGSALASSKSINSSAKPISSALQNSWTPSTYLRVKNRLAVSPQAPTSPSFARPSQYRRNPHTWALVGPSSPLIRHFSSCLASSLPSLFHRAVNLLTNPLTLRSPLSFFSPSRPSSCDPRSSDSWTRAHRAPIRPSRDLRCSIRRGGYCV